jgi:hypothetical protein
MPMCSDPAITYLRSVGFSVVRLPRPDFRPLQIFADDGHDLSPLGDLAELMKAPVGVAPPAVETDLPGPSISGSNASTLSVGVGLHVLGTALAAMGAGKLGLDVAYKSASTVTFEFLKTTTDRVAVVAVDKYLGRCDVDPDARGVGKMLEADDVYVITATIKSTSITVTSKASGGAEAKLEVPDIEKIVGGKVKVSADDKSSAKITYTGRVPLVFGFQAVRLFYDRGAYTTFEPLQSGKIAAKALDPGAFGAPDLPAGVRPLERAAPMVRIGEA